MAERRSIQGKKRAVAAPGKRAGDGAAVTSPNAREAQDDQAKRTARLAREDAHAAKQANGAASRGAQGAQGAQGARATKDDAQSEATGTRTRASSKRSSLKGASQKGPKVLRVLGIVGIALAVIALALGIALWVVRWVLPDDAADLRGVWYVNGSTGTITITEDHLVLPPDAPYSYTLDTTAKTISYSFGNATGVSHYRFSDDRNTVALIEDGYTVWSATLLDDLSWWLGSLGERIGGVVVAPVKDASISMILTRASAQTNQANE